MRPRTVRKAASTAGPINQKTTEIDLKPTRQKCKFPNRLELGRATRRRIAASSQGRGPPDERTNKRTEMDKQIGIKLNHLSAAPSAFASARIAAGQNEAIEKRRTTRLSSGSDLASAAAADDEPEQTGKESMIRLKTFIVPNQARVGELRRLSCDYDLQKATLHAMKLFKDNKEFYRYTPGPEQKQIFQVVGVQVDKKRSNDKDVWLQINRRSSGLYKCQVLVEGTFNSVSAEKRLEVSDSAPSARNGADQSSPSVWQSANAASARSKVQNGGAPAAAARWPAGSGLSPHAVHQQASQLYGAHATSGAPAAPRSHTLIVITLLLLLLLVNQPARVSP